jgi:hypothetical protein
MLLTTSRRVHSTQLSIADSCQQQTCPQQSGASNQQHKCDTRPCPRGKVGPAAKATAAQTDGRKKLRPCMCLCPRGKAGLAAVPTEAQAGGRTWLHCCMCHCPRDKAGPAAVATEGQRAGPCWLLRCMCHCPRGKAGAAAVATEAQPGGRSGAALLHVSSSQGQGGCCCRAH